MKLLLVNLFTGTVGNLFANQGLLTSQSTFPTQTQFANNNPTLSQVNNSNTTWSSLFGGSQNQPTTINSSQNTGQGLFGKTVTTTVTQQGSGGLFSKIESGAKSTLFGQSPPAQSQTSDSTQSTTGNPKQNSASEKTGIIQ